MSALPPPGPPLSASDDDDQDDAAEPGPEAGRGEAGEGQRAGADLQRHDGDGDAEQQRDQHAVDEADPVTGEQLRQGAGVEQRAVAVDALGAEQRTRSTVHGRRGRATDAADEQCGR